MSSSLVLKKIRKHARELKKDFRVKEIYLFGSVARNQATAKSDVDLLIEFSSNDVGLFEFIRLKDYLESILGRHVDLVTRDALKEWMRAEIEREAVRAA
jgi:uncharacterized protein